MLLANLVSERTALQRDRHRLYLANGKKARLQRQLAALQDEDDRATVATDQLSLELCVFEKDCDLLRDAAARVRFPQNSTLAPPSAHQQGGEREIGWRRDLQVWMDEMESSTTSMKKAFKDRVQDRACKAASEGR